MRILLPIFLLLVFAGCSSSANLANNSNAPNTSTQTYESLRNSGTKASVNKWPETKSADPTTNRVGTSNKKKKGCGG